MSATKFTPGPWTVEEEAFDNDGYPETVIRALGGEAGVAVTIDFGSYNPRMREANAHLFAALRIVLEKAQLTSGVRIVVEAALAKAEGVDVIKGE